MTIRQVFDELVVLDPRYRWEEVDGVSVFRPVTAWDAANNALNRQATPFDWPDVTAWQAVDRLTALVFARPATERPTFAGRTFSPVFRGGRVLDALNTIVKASGELTWAVQPDPQNSERLLVTLKDFHGAGAVATWNIAP